MAYDASKPANDGFIADAPAEIRANNVGLKDDQIVDAGKLKGLSPGNASGNIPISNGTINVNLNADKVDGKDASDFATANHTHAAATTSTSGFLTGPDMLKLNGIAAGAEVNQMAFGNVLVGSTTIQADAKTDTLEMVAGTNIAITPDATNDRITISVTGKVPSAAAADTAAACTGNAATATTASTATTITGTIPGNQIVAARGNTSTDLGTAKELRWRNFGNNHTIIDNSASEYPGGNANAQNAWSPTYPVLMGYNGSATYGVRVDSARVADSAGSAPANGGTSVYATYLKSTSHPSDYYISNAWDGTYWRLTSNHGSPVRVGYADSVPWGGITGMPANMGTNCWISGEYAPIANTPTIVTHGLTLSDPLKCRCDVLLKCVSAEGGYNAGDYAINACTKVPDVDSYMPLVPVLGATTIQINNGTMRAMNKANGTTAVLTITKWVYVFRVWY